MNFHHSILFFAGLSLAAATHAQSKDPFDPNAPVVPSSYQSTFADYRGYQDPAIASWKQTNEEVGQGSGHGNHAGHSQSNPSQGPAKKDPGATPQSMPDHPGMHKK